MAVIKKRKVRAAISSRNKEYEINPVVGIGNRKIEQFVSDLTGDPFTLDYTTIHTNIGYIMPKKTYTTWPFAEGDDIDRKAPDFAGAVMKFLMPLYKKQYSLGDFDKNNG